MNVWGCSRTLNAPHCACMQGSDVGLTAVMGQNDRFLSRPLRYKLRALVILKEIQV